MKVLVLGGTALSGPFIVRKLLDHGHEVTVYHRGQSESPFLPACDHVYGDRKDFETFEAALRDIEAEAVIDLFSANGLESECVVRAFRGRIKSSVHISSGDVYRDIGTDRLLSEDAPWREGLPYGGKLGEEYDKKKMETTVTEACATGGFPATVIRYPVIYGPGVGNAAYREWTIIQRVLDARKQVAIPQIAFEIPMVRGYVENLAGGVVAALETDNASGKTYNLADTQAMMLPELAREIATILGRSIEPVAVPTNQFKGTVYNGVLGRYDLTRAKADLGFQDLVDIRTALERAVQWQVEHPPQNSDIVVDADAYATEDQMLTR